MAGGPAKPSPSANDPSKWHLMWGLAPPAADAPDPVTPQPAEPTPPPPLEATTAASDGGPSWLTGARVGRKNPAMARPHAGRLHAASSAQASQDPRRQLRPSAGTHAHDPVPPDALGAGGGTVTPAHDDRPSLAAALTSAARAAFGD